MNYPEKQITPDPVVEAYKNDIDRALIGDNIKFSYEERLLKLMEHQRFAEELRQAGRRARRESEWWISLGYCGFWMSTAWNSSSSASGGGNPRRYGEV